MSTFLEGLPPWQPQHDQLLVRPLTAADRTTGGVIIIPDSARDRPQQGVVIAVGPGAHAQMTGVTIPMAAEVGDLVAFGKYAGMDFDIDGKLVLIMRDVEALIRRPAGTYTLVEHEGGKFAHVDGYVCEHCPKVVSELIEQERERLRQARKEFVDAPWPREEPRPAFVDAPPEDVERFETDGGRAGR